MLHIFLYIFLPAGLNVLCCLLMFFLPPSSSKGCVRSLNTILSVLIFWLPIVSIVMVAYLNVPSRYAPLR